MNVHSLSTHSALISVSLVYGAVCIVLLIIGFLGFKIVFPFPSASPSPFNWLSRVDVPTTYTSPASGVLVKCQTNVNILELCSYPLVATANDFHWLGPLIAQTVSQS